MPDRNAFSLPYSRDAERALIGCILADAQNVLPKVAPIVSPRDFFGEGTRAAYAAALTLWAKGESVDELTLHERSGVDIALLVEMSASVPTALHAETYARTVRDLAIRRAVIEKAEMMARAAYDGDIETTLAAAQRVLERVIGGEGVKIEHARDMLARAYDDIERESVHGANHIPLPLPRLSRVLRPRAGEMVILAARPGEGKTSFAMQATIHAARQGVPTLFVSLEMERSGLARLIAAQEGAGAGDILAALAGARDALARVPLYFLVQRRMTPAHVSAFIRAWLAQHARECEALVVVDYSVEMAITHRERFDLALGDALRRVRGAIAPENGHRGAACLMLHQLGRPKGGGEYSAERPPTLSDLQHSSAVEQVADAVLALAREKQPAPGETVPAHLWLLKNRHGPGGGRLPLVFRGAERKFYEIEENTRPQRFVPGA